MGCLPTLPGCAARLGTSVLPLLASCLHFHPVSPGCSLFLGIFFFLFFFLIMNTSCVKSHFCCGLMPITAQSTICIFTLTCPWLNLETGGASTEATLRRLLAPMTEERHEKAPRNLTAAESDPRVGLGFIFPFMFCSGRATH